MYENVEEQYYQIGPINIGTCQMYQWIMTCVRLVIVFVLIACLSQFEIASTSVFPFHHCIAWFLMIVFIDDILQSILQKQMFPYGTPC
jgi:hypothetical protein